MNSRQFVCVGLLLLLLVGAAVAQQCPNGCSGHGTCSGSVCSCNSGYTGDDCSSPISALSPNTVVTGTVGARAMNYYTVTFGAQPISFTVQVNQTVLGQDCDLYLAYNYLPSRYQYDYRDVGSSSSSTVTANRPIAAGTWNIGVYGFTACTYNLQAIVAGGGVNTGCPNSCSGHGSCVGGVCQCAVGWNGTDCSVPLIPISAGVPQSSTVSVSRWIYYSINIGASANQLLVVVNQTSAVGTDCDLYIRQNALPDQLHYNYRDASSQQNFQINIANPGSGVWYLGVYGFTTCSYTLRASLGDMCPNQCSNHGSCLGGGTTCSCSPGYQGTMCETMYAGLTANVAVSGYVGDNTFNYYHFTAFSAVNMLITVTQTAGGDCDLYVKSSHNPTRTDYDYRDIGFNTNSSVTIPNPSSKVWYIGVFGYRACSYTMIATTTSNCPNSCSGHGTCTASGQCLCASGWSGPSCSSQSNVLQNGVTLSSNVSANGWVYYTFAKPNPAPSSVTFYLKETTTTGFLWLYVLRDSAPTMTTWDGRDNSHNAIHVVSAGSQLPSNQWYVGVYGSPFAIGSRPVNFNLTVWATPF